MPTTPGSAPSASTNALLAARAAARVGTSPWCLPGAASDTPERGRGAPSGDQPLRPELPQDRCQGVGEGDAGSGAATLGAAGEEQGQRCAVPAAPDHRAAVAARAEGADVPLDLELVVEAVH